MRALLLRLGLLFALLVPLAPAADAQFGVARSAVTAAKGLKVAIASDQSNVNLRTVANAAGYSGAGNVQITINSGVDVYSTSTGTAALVPGSWPAGVTITLINKGTVTGAGGAGGTGGGTAGTHGGNGGSGGTALSASGISGFTFSVDNGSGTIRGGGGGGGGGGMSAYDSDGDGFGDAVGAGGGGGGQGRNGGGGGGGGSSNYTDGVTTGNGSSGTAGSTGSNGFGGASAQPGQLFGSGNGGNGGAFGSGGQAGFNGGGGLGGTDAGGAAGGGGNSVTGNANINWIATGTRTGPVS